MVGFGVVGFGLFGQHHARAVAETDGAQLKAVAVKSEASRDRARQAHPTVDVLGDYRRLLTRDDIDVVIVVVPNHLHFEVGRDVLEAGKHLMLEKPMALNVADCDALVELARRNDRLIAINHELRLSSLWGGARQLIEQGVIGEPRHVLIELSRFPYRQGSEGWRYDRSRVGSWILEEPIHFFDLARWYLSDSGDPVSVYARANARRADQGDLRDHFSAFVNHADGNYAVVSQTLSAFGHHQTGKISGTEGTIWAWWSAADARSDKPTFGMQYGLGDQVTEVTFDRPTGELLELADHIAAIVDCVRNGTPPPCSGIDGRWSTALCLAAEESVRSGQIVETTTNGPARQRRNQGDMR